MREITTLGRASIVLAVFWGADSRADPAAVEPVDLELILAVDVSGSIDQAEAIVQRNGYVAAFTHPRLIDAIQSGRYGRIAVSYFEWAGFDYTRIVADWTLIHDRDSAQAFARRLTAMPPRIAGVTAMSHAIDFAALAFEQNAFAGDRKVIDISGDGANNWGGRVTVARDAAVLAGITINGLPIMNDRPSRSGAVPPPDLDLYYRHCVIGGFGAFIEVSNTLEDFRRAVLRKLILEVAGTRPSDLLVPAAAPAPPSCDF